MFGWLRKLLAPPPWLEELGRESKRLEALRESDPDAYRREIRKVIVRANDGIEGEGKP